MTDIKAWQVRPWGRTGDPNPDHLFLSVGYALTMWEALESALAELFDALVASGNRVGFMVYISIRTSSARSEMLHAAADRALRQEPTLQIRVFCLLERIEKFRARRNEIAHGRVYNFFEAGFCFAPNNIAPQKFKNANTASYQWVAVDVRYYGDEFQKLAAEAVELSSLVKSSLAGQQSPL